jgi:hypothetical protein
MESSLTGYAPITTIGKAMAGDLADPLRASVIPNIDPPAGWMRRLVHAMNTFNGTKQLKFIRATQLFYLLGPEKTLEIVDKIGERQLRRWAREGERLIKLELG